MARRKQKKRNRRNSEHGARTASSLSVENEFPLFAYEWEPSHKYLPQPFIEIIKKVTESIDFTDAQYFDERDVRFYRHMRKNGFLSAVDMTSSAYGFPRLRV